MQMTLSLNNNEIRQMFAAYIQSRLGTPIKSDSMQLVIDQVGGSVDNQAHLAKVILEVAEGSVPAGQTLIR